MKKIILITSADLCQNNVFNFVQEISKIYGYSGHVNLLAKDHINFYLKYDRGPNSLNELKAFVIENFFNDPEAYLFENDYKNSNGVLLKQVTPLKFLYEFANKNFLCESCYANSKGEGPGLHSDIKMECDNKLVTHNPGQMREILQQRLWPQMTPHAGIWI